MATIAEADLDQILALQFAVAWIGERGDPPRFGWWHSDLVDENAGGDLFARLLPRTKLWAALCAVREVARRADSEGRKSLGDPDKLVTTFSLGFEVDEQLDDRLRELKRRGAAPSEALALPVAPVAEGFSRAAARAALLPPSGAAPEFTVVAGGRQLKALAATASVVEQTRALAAVLVATEPVPEKYPLAFLRRAS